jgi:hypothetical protein
MNTTTDIQYSMCQWAGGSLARLYRAVEELRDEGMTREEFRIMCRRRPEKYGPIAYLHDCNSFWNL